jgi:phage shock protein PspC (stress-responsive transcriptional regulator)
MTLTEPVSTDSASTIEEPHDVPEPDEHVRLRRSRSHRMVAGVAGGIAERFDIDVSLVRVAFVVLACAWGAGAVLYAAMWALVPSEAGDKPTRVVDVSTEPTAPWLAFLLLGGVLVFGLLLVTSWLGGPRWGGGLGLMWVVLLIGFLVVGLQQRPRRAFRRVLASLALIVITFAIVIVGSFLGLVASTGVPLTGGIGERVYQPSDLAQVQSSYRTGVGNMTVDLRRVHFVPGKPLHVTATVGVGQVTVDVPPGVVVDVNAHAGLGKVTSSPGDLQSFGGGGAGAHPELDLTVAVGVGEVELVRAAAS